MQSCYVLNPVTLARHNFRVVQKLISRLATSRPHEFQGKNMLGREVAERETKSPARDEVARPACTE